MEYNIYCDESCHLLHDDSKVMVMGAVWCPREKCKEIFTRIREIKLEYGVSEKLEIKWNKVSDSKIDLYLSLVDYFFDDDDIHFRTLVVPNKNELNHDFFGQTHDNFYYKMYFDLLKVIFIPNDSYNIYIDIKDTQSQHKVEKLAEVLRSSHYDFQKKIIKKIQQIRSDEIELMQITDLLIGAVGYLHRGLSSSSSKLKIIKRIQKRSGYNLLRTTLYRENKVNVFIWKSAAI